MNENGLENLDNNPEKEKREMGLEEIEAFGDAMEEYYEELRQEKLELEKQLFDSQDYETTLALERDLELINMQLAEDHEGFIEDIKAAEISEATIKDKK